VNIYVDEHIWPYRGMRMCHMMCEPGGEEGLHEMAEKLGLRKSWFQTRSSVPHYDVCKAKRAQAIKLGAVPCGREKTLELIKAHRQATQGQH